MEEIILDKSSRAILKAEKFETSQAILKIVSSSEWLGDHGEWAEWRERSLGRPDHLGLHVKGSSLNFSKRYGIPGEDFNHGRSVHFRKIIPTAICRMGWSRTGEEKELMRGYAVKAWAKA